MGETCVLIEREHFLESLTSLLDAAVGGTGRFVFLGEESGAGKTALADAVVEAASGRLTVRRGGCDHVTTPAALGPLVDAVPELADVIQGEAAVSRARLFRQLRALLSTPTLLVVEDVHWGDEATLEMLRFLGRRLHDMPVFVIATFRDDEVLVRMCTLRCSPGRTSRGR
jgi:predicted ATPase